MMKSPENHPPQPESRDNDEVRDSVSKTDMLAVKNEGVMSVTKSSAGPGGQNVNKTAKTAEFRWTPAISEIFNAREKKMIINWMCENKPSQLVGDDEIYITANTHKSLEGNKKQVLKILHQYLKDALTLPKERVPTKPSRGAVERRIQDKKATARKKTLRGTVEF